MSLRVAIATEDPLAKSGIAQLVDESDGLELSSEAEAEIVVWEGSADALPVEQTPIIALGDPAAFRELLRAGARAVLGRDTTAVELEAAAIAVSKGLIVLTEAALAELGGGGVEIADAPAEPLTPRELEVLALMAEGLSNRLIGIRLGISENTVKFHVNALLAKLDAETRTEAVVRGARLGLVLL